MTRGGRPKERTFAVPAEVARLRAELLAAFSAGELARWAELTSKLKRALQARRGEMLTSERLKDIELNFGPRSARASEEERASYV